MKKLSIILTEIGKTIILTTLFCFLINLNTVDTINCYAKETKLIASWYSRASLIEEGTWKDGKEMRMANGQIFNENNFTCATRLYPLGTMLLISNPITKRKVVVKVTDRIGKRFAQTRIDLSQKAFSLLANCKQGIVSVEVTELK